MDRKTDLKNMDAPAVNSGKVSDDTILAVKSASKTASESAKNELTEYTTEKPSMGKTGGRAKF